MNVTTLNQYQSEAKQYAKYSMAGYPFAALGEEAGEVLGKIAKFMRKHDESFDTSITTARCINDVLKGDLVKELGDVMWQLSACANELGVSLEYIAQENLDKLGGRASRGTLIGEGDER